MYLDEFSVLKGAKVYGLDGLYDTCTDLGHVEDRLVNNKQSPTETDVMAAAAEISSEAVQIA